jgi:hypothetical protein
MTVGIKWPGPLPSKRDPRAARAQGSKTRPSKGAITDQWSRSPLSESGRRRYPQFKKITDQQLVGRFDRRPPESCRCKKSGAPSCHPATALLIRGSKPNPRRVRTGAPDQQSQRRRGRARSSLSSSSPARGRPTCRIHEPTRAASRGIPSRQSFRALAP